VASSNVVSRHAQSSISANLSHCCRGLRAPEVLGGLGYRSLTLAGDRDRDHVATELLREGRLTFTQPLGGGERTTTGAYWDDSTGSTTNRELIRVCGASCGNFGSVPGLGAVDIPDPREHSALQIADVRVAGLDQDS
jgi:hypothetical protein